MFCLFAVVDVRDKGDGRAVGRKVVSSFSGCMRPFSRCKDNIISFAGGENKERLMKRGKAKEDRRVAGNGEAGVFQEGRKGLLSGAPPDKEHDDIEEEAEYAGYDTSYPGRLRFAGGGFVLSLIP